MTLSLGTKRLRTRSISPNPGTSRSHTTTLSAEQTPKSKKLKLHASFLTESPFPKYAHPTYAEALEVFSLLSTAHGHVNRPSSLNLSSSVSSNDSVTVKQQPTRTRDDRDDDVNILEGLISTILSQNTSGINSSRAKANLDAIFGRNNFAAMVSSPRGMVVDAIRCGGLANKKAETIQKILQSVKERHGDYSLQHLAALSSETSTRMSDDEIMKELLSYDGVGPKTASCVLLFCLNRDSFAVDTHVFRITKMLGWVPEKADRVLAQAHLDLRVPSELKYGLHVLLIQHGRACRGCKTEGLKEPCILKDYKKEKASRSESNSNSKFGINPLRVNSS